MKKPWPFRSNLAPAGVPMFLLSLAVLVGGLLLDSLSSDNQIALALIYGGAGPCVGSAGLLIFGEIYARRSGAR
jgi:hypothetical protein